ncbi:MAG: EexN family lipoprotein [Steroidobacteraceae bacterium]
MGIRSGAQHVRTYLGIVVTIGSVVACAPAPEPAAVDVAFFRAHLEERRTVLATCRRDPGRLRDARSCINAREAERLESQGRLRDLPPLDLPPKE